MYICNISVILLNEYAVETLFLLCKAFNLR